MKKQELNQGALAARTASHTPGARESFVARFGEEQARLIEAAAHEHENGVNSTRKGSDPFRWAICIAIGYQCAEVDRYRDYHGITAPWDEVKAWIKSDGHLNKHDGDVDYLSLFAGTYNDYMPPAGALP